MLGNGCARAFGTGFIEQVHFAFEAIFGLADAVGIESAGFEDIGTGIEILLVNGANDIGSG